MHELREPVLKCVENGFQEQSHRAAAILKLPGICYEATCGTNASSVKYFAGMVSNRLRGMRGVTVLQADRVIFTAPGGSPVYVQVDGESAGCLPAEIRIVRDAVTLMVPPEYARTAGERPLAQPNHV